MARSMTVTPVEDFWMAINMLTAAMTVFGLADAIRARRVVRALNGRAREIVAAGNVRNEFFRMVKASILLVLGLWAVSVPGDTPLSPFVVLMMAYALTLFIGTALDRRDRQALLHLVATDA
jgi:soluble P-type ATPase